MTPLRHLDPIPHRERTVGGLLARRAAANGDRPYLIFEGRRFTYAEVDRLATRLANGLLGIGIRKGDHVALLFDNRPEMLWLYFALGRCGAVAVPINTAARGEQLAYFLRQSDASAILLDTAHAARVAEVRAQCPKLAHAVAWQEEGDVPADLAAQLDLAVTPYAEIAAASDAPVPVEVAFNDPFCLLYTSGTTGPSKGNIGTHCSVLSAPITRVEMFGYRREDVLYVCLPLFHSNALNGGCMSGLVAEATVALARRFSARSFWKDIRAVGATKFNLLSAMVNILWNQPPSPEDDDGIRRQTTMVPIPAFGEDFAKRFNLELTSVYSLSDYANATMLPPGHPPEKSRSAGQPRPQMQVAILDDEDFPLPAGQVGEICLRANEPWIAAQGYYAMPEATLKAWRNLWFHTGDRGWLDADGYLWFVDRKKDAIRRRGENISAWEVEQIIARHPAVAEVAAFAVRAEMAEDEVMVVVRRHAGVAFDEVALVAFCRTNMAYFMVPRFVEFATELPKTLTQKVLKYRLQEEAQGRLDRIWDRERAGIVIGRDG
jgi:crotonobetaine/carnitine-CoA ligase